VAALLKGLSLDDTLALRRDPYRFISGRADELGTDVFETRLMLRRTVCMTGADAARLFYDANRFRRAGAAPEPLQKTLFGEGGVQGLDGEDHRRRKSMFLEINQSDRVEDLAAVVHRQWRGALVDWAAAGQIELYPQIQRLLTVAVCEWAGAPLGADEVEPRTRELSALFDDAATVGIGHLRSRAARRSLEDWAERVVREVRSGIRPIPQGSAAGVIAHHRDTRGDLLEEWIAAVELLNVLRPTVAVAVYITFVAHALEMYPDWRVRLAHGDGGEDRAFVEEVRRHYPFFPAVTAVARETFDWHGHRFHRGRRVMLDLYGTNHDARLWDDPHRFAPERFLGPEPDVFAFVPQGGGDPAVHHRCPGEPITTRLMRLAVHMLVRGMTYTPVPPTCAVDFDRLPALPENGYLISDIAPAPAAG
jgi:fatty-acid peroxygenase